MSAEPTPRDEPQDAVAAQLSQLVDLFRRRLLEDRTQRQLLAEQQERIARLEGDISGERLVPLLRGLRLVIDRVRLHDDDGFGPSVAEEILDVVSGYGIEPIDDLGPFDAARHEVVEVTGKPTAAVVTRIVSVGFMKNGRTLVPALVAVAQAE